VLFHVVESSENPLTVTGRVPIRASGSRAEMRDLGSGMNQFAAERYAQELSIRYVSGPRNHPNFEGRAQAPGPSCFRTAMSLKESGCHFYLGPTSRAGAGGRCLPAAGRVQIQPPQPSEFRGPGPGSRPFPFVTHCRAATPEDAQ